jgi:clan AA aspartic protease
LTKIEGTVTGPTGKQAKVEFLVDSGAMYTLLPRKVWRAIGLKPLDSIKCSLADGTTVERKVSECHIALPQGERSTPVLLGEKGDEALLGTVTLEEPRVVLNPFTRQLQPLWKHMSSNTKYLLLVGSLVIATFLRFYLFTTVPPGPYPDEAMDGNNAAEVAQTGHYQVFYPEDNGREGLYVNLIAILLKYFHAPHEAWTIRLPAAIAGVLTVGGVYVLVTELFGDRPGLLAAFLLATSFWHINFSRIGFRAILAPLFLVGSLLFLIKAFKAARSPTAVGYAVMSGIVYALGFYTYIAYRVTPLLFLLFVPFFKKYPGFWKRAVAFTVATFVVTAPIGWYFVKHPDDLFGRTSQISLTSAANPVKDLAVNIGKTLLMFNVHGDNNWRHNVSGAPELFLPLGILFLIGIVGGLYSLRKKWRSRERSLLPTFALLLTFLWFLLGMLPAVFSGEGIPHALRSILMLPPALIFATLGGIWLYGIIKTHGLRTVAIMIAVIFFISVAVFAYVDYFIVWAQDPNVPVAFNAEYVTIGNKINALPSSAPKYVVAAVDGVIARGLPVPLETIMFITDTFLPAQQDAKNVHYLLFNETNQIPPGAPVFIIR